MNWAAIAMGFFSLGIIGLGFFWVIRMEYYLGYLWWPYVLAVGVLLLGGSLFVADAGWSALLGIFGGSVFWGATELKEQAVRAEVGWFKFRSPKQEPPGVERIRKWHAPHL